MLSVVTTGDRERRFDSQPLKRRNHQSSAVRDKLNLWQESSNW